MNYIILDFEWNQPVSENTTVHSPIRFDSEIIEIGAVRLDDSFEKTGEFQSYVKPVYYPVMNGDVSTLTKIRTQKLQGAPGFPEVYRAFSAWCGADCCLCTWGRNDIPVLFDNLIMHNIQASENTYWCDLQEIFGNEIMRDGKHWSLSSAVDILKLPKERAHDALNDARNTHSICNRVDLLSNCDYYGNCYVNYEKDRLNGLITGRRYQTEESAQQDMEMSSVICPYCGETVVLGDRVKQSKRFAISYGCCSEGDEFLARFQKKHRGDSEIVISRTVSTMSDVLWEKYQDALERMEDRFPIAV